MANSRQKGAKFERDVALKLFLETGIQFQRNLEQYRKKNEGDLVADAHDWPFLIECKAYASGTDCKLGWIQQAVDAAEGTGKIPVVIYKFNLHPIKCRVPISAIVEAHGASSSTDKWADVTLQGLAYIARELMARRSNPLAKMQRSE